MSSKVDKYINLNFSKMCDVSLFQIYYNLSNDLTNLRETFVRQDKETSDTEAFHKEKDSISKDLEQIRNEIKSRLSDNNKNKKQSLVDNAAFYKWFKEYEKFMDNLSEDEFLEMITLQEEYIKSDHTSTELQNFYTTRTNISEPVEKPRHKLFRK